MSGLCLSGLCSVYVSVSALMVPWALWSVWMVFEWVDYV